MMFPQNDTFIYYPETEDSYGTITEGTGITCLGYIEQEVTFDGNGAIRSKGKIFTTDLTPFKIDAKVAINDEIFYIKEKNYYNIPNYNYYELAYV